jgi:hypothetical protein
MHMQHLQEGKLMKKLSPKQKKMAALAGNKSKIDAPDLKMLRASKGKKQAMPRKRGM